MYIKASRRSLYLLDKCITSAQVKQIQCHFTVTANRLDPFAAGKIISFFAVSGKADVSYAYQLFLCVQHRTTFIWNTMIRAFVETNQNIRALSLYKNMLQSGFLPNNYTFSFVLRACTEISYPWLAAACHGQVIKLGWNCYDFVQNGLIHFYSSCSLMDLAHKVFDMSTNRDVITWTALINGYIKCGKVEVAQQLFDKMPDKNTISWSSLINGYVQLGLFREALDLFNYMLVSGFEPNQAAVLGALAACASIGALALGRWIHAFVDRNRMELDRVLGAALIDMYAKCGCIKMACGVFDRMRNRDVFAFTSLISGLANHGQSAAALELFARMQKGVVPNQITFVCILSACSRMGLVDEGLRIFNSMSEVYKIQPEVQHYGCLVDLLGRAGMLEDAEKLVREMPLEPDSFVLGALLNACRVHGNVELGKETVRSLAERSLAHDGVHVLLSNMYASVNRWDGVVKVRDDMKDNNVKKVPGCSLIEVDGKVCEFVAGDGHQLKMKDAMLLLLGIHNHFEFTQLDDAKIAVE